ncbi:MAG: hypothetical protein R3232_10600 [Clostridia bacterium]|nr:hypothetical protein [Clostridia bacterium]
MENRAGTGMEPAAVYYVSLDKLKDIPEASGMHVYDDCKDAGK